MAPRAQPVRLRIGDVVSVQIACFGEEYARGKAGERWRDADERDQGTIVGRDGERWLIDFEDGEAVQGWKRQAVRFESRAEAAAGTTRASAVQRDDDGSSDEEQQETEQAAQANADSSDEDEDEVEMPCIFPAEHGEGLGPAGAAAEGQWTRDDVYSVDERARHGFMDKPVPVLRMTDREHASLYRLGRHFLPMAYLEEMAGTMTRTAGEKARQGARRFNNFRVTVQDLLQWIGCWIYMLAFNQSGGHRAYFGPQPFGPSHRLEDILGLVSPSDKKKGIEWFENMLGCFTLPIYSSAAHAHDPFRPTRKYECTHHHAHPPPAY